MCRVGFDVALAYVWWSRGFVDATVSSLLKLSKNALDGVVLSFFSMLIVFKLLPW